MAAGSTLGRVMPSRIELSILSRNDAHEFMAAARRSRGRWRDHER
jgi:hypothetical protein